MKTFRLWLEPDRDIPQFECLRWELTDVPIADVLLSGVHPWMGADKHPSLPEVFLQRLNADDAKLSALAPMGYSHDLTVAPHAYWEERSQFDKILHAVRDQVRFVNNLEFLELRRIAVDRLREAWNKYLALKLAQAAYPTFADLRTFLKGKDKTLKLSGYEDLDRYDLSEVLTVEDFADQDALLIAEGVPVHNFRPYGWLATVMDDCGRLRLASEIRHVTLRTTVQATEQWRCGVQVTWQATRKGRTLTLHPDLGNELARREPAKQFAQRWRTDHGRLSFQTSVERLSEMVETGAVQPDFPTLNYRSPLNGPTATAEPLGNAIRAYVVCGFPNSKRSAETLKEVLRSHGISMSGNKDVLLEKLAKLAAEKYRERHGELDTYFSQRRFLRMNDPPRNAVAFDILDNLPQLHHLVLAMYVLKHLRGNAVLEGNHENDTYDLEDLALALVTGKTGLTGAFLPVT